jgi:hypothetical protein
MVCLLVFVHVPTRFAGIGDGKPGEAANPAVGGGAPTAVTSG